MKRREVQPETKRGPRGPVKRMMEKGETLASQS